jgi:hypothetical protein
MEQFGRYVHRDNPILSVFREELRRRYELCDEPLPKRLEELVHRLADAPKADSQ